MWDLPGPGIEPMSPALAGGFLTTAPPGKPFYLLQGRIIYNNIFVYYIKHSILNTVWMNEWLSMIVKSSSSEAWTACVSVKLCHVTAVWPWAINKLSVPVSLPNKITVLTGPSEVVMKTTCKAFGTFTDTYYILNKYLLLLLLPLLIIQKIMGGEPLLMSYHF